MSVTAAFGSYLAGLFLSLVFWFNRISWLKAKHRLDEECYMTHDYGGCALMSVVWPVTLAVYTLWLTALLILWLGELVFVRPGSWLAGK
jgi:hypothetical protein